MSQRQAIAHTPLIPREVLFENPDKAMPKVSHDGKLLAFLTPLAGVLNVDRMPTRSGSPQPVERADRNLETWQGVP